MGNNSSDVDINLNLKQLQGLGLFIQDIEKDKSYPGSIWNDMGYTSEEMSGRGFLDYVHPEDLPEIQKQMRNSASLKNSNSRFIYRMKTKSGDWRWILTTIRGVEFSSEGKVIKYIGYDIDISEQIIAKEQAEKARREAEILRSTGEIITSQLDLPHTIRAIFEQAERVIHFTSASVQLLKNHELEIVGETGFHSNDSMLGIKFPIKEDIPNSQIIREKKALLINRDLKKKFPGFKDLSGANILSWMGVPLIFKERVIGMMSFDHSLENQFTIDNFNLAQSFASQVAIALENSRLYEDAKEMAIRDSLTGCFSRRHLYDCLERESNMAWRYENKLSLLIFDIDDFKKINDSYGHLVGDDILKDIVNLTLSTLRKSDILFRYGGEEFVVILPSDNKDDAYKTSERIRKTIYRELKHTSVNHSISVSIGCTTVNFSDKNNLENILHRADTALYKAKNSGKNRTCSL